MSAQLNITDLLGEDMLEADFRELVSSLRYFKDSTLLKRRQAVKRKWTQLSANSSTTRRVRTRNGGLSFELHDLAVFLVFIRVGQMKASCTYSTEC